MQNVYFNLQIILPVILVTAMCTVSVISVLCLSLHVPIMRTGILLSCLRHQIKHGTKKVNIFIHSQSNLF
jgi:hypothetical protein